MNFLPRAFSFQRCFRSHLAPNVRRCQIGSLERLEDRQLLTTFLVTSTDDSTNMGTLRWAIDQANSSVGSDSIEFDASFDSPQTITLNGTPLPKLTDFTGETRITGPGKELLTISANDLSRIFEVGSGDLTLIGMTLKDGNAGQSPSGESEGGAIHADGALNVINVGFVSNRAVTGGAIYAATGASVSVDFADFSSNSAQDGGAIAIGISHFTLTVGNSTFTENTAEFHGGAIYLQDAVLNVYLTDFDGNSADRGGAIANSYGVLTVSTSTLQANTATETGGAIWNASGIAPSPIARVTDSTLSENTAIEGGAIYNVGTLAVEGSTLSENTATYGGAISNDLTMNLLHTTFTGNDATDRGGAVYNLGATNVLGCTFDGNQAVVQGGAIASPRTIYISDSTFNANSAPHGGALQTYGGSQVIGSTFNGNSAVYGGAISNDNGSAMQMSGVTITNNTAEIGGGVYSTGLTWAGAVTLTTNTATNSGGGIYQGATGHLYVGGGRMTGNHAQNGGGIFAGSTSSVAIEVAAIRDNSATLSGGGIFVSVGSTVLMTRTEISGNSAGLGGGLLNRGSMRMASSTFSNNNAEQGGAIYHGFEPGGVGAELHAVNLTIADNHASSQGGGIFQAPDDDPARLQSTIVARNDRQGSPDDISGMIDVVNSRKNLIGPGGAGGLNDGINGNIVLTEGEFLGLGAFGEDGSLRKSYPLLAGSPAIDAGGLPYVDFLPLTDQRATFPRTVGSATDIGAIESSHAVIAVSIAEHTTFVATIQSNGLVTAPLSYTITGGDDQASFVLNPVTHDLQFISAPEFADPTDADHDNVYRVEVTVTDGQGRSGVRQITVSVQSDILPPVFILTETAEYHVGGAPIVDSAAVFQADASLTDFSTGKLVVTVLNADGQDKIEILGKGKNGSSIRVKKNTILFNDIVVGTIEKRTKISTNLTIKFNSQTTAESIQGIARQIGFSTRNKNSGQLPRTIQMQIFDVPSGTTTTATRQVSVVVEL